MDKNLGANESNNSANGNDCPTLWSKSNLVTADRIGPIWYFEE